MDLSGIVSSSSSNISDAGVSQSVAIDVLKKAENIDQSNATALIQGITPPPAAPNLPAHLGNNVNTVA